VSINADLVAIKTEPVVERPDPVWTNPDPDAHENGPCVDERGPYMDEAGASIDEHGGFGDGNRISGLPLDRPGLNTTSLDALFGYSLENSPSRNECNLPPNPMSET
jgi:hypothetical protein